jgi:hypothetical protein
MAMRKLFICLWPVLFWAAASLAADQQPPIAKDVPPGHPEIERIREIYREVRADIAARRLAVSVREFAYCEP